MISIAWTTGLGEFSDPLLPTHYRDHQGLSPPQRVQAKVMAMNAVTLLASSRSAS